MKEFTESETEDILCRSRIYECLGCDFVGAEEKALEHQIKCDNPMELLR